MVELTQPTDADATSLAIRSLDGSLTSLDVFEPESLEPDNSTPDDPVSERAQVSLATVLAARIVFDPIDVVAIGLALCRAFMGAQLRRQLNPGVDLADLLQPITIDNVLIDASGRVRGSVGNLDDEPGAVQAIGQLLSEILPVGNSSFLKSKVLSKAVASPPEFASVGDFSKALETLAGPNGRQLLEGVYELWRAQAAAPAVMPAQVDSLPTPPVQLGAETKPPTEAATAGAQRLKQSRQFRIGLASAAIFGGLGILGVAVSLLFNSGTVARETVDVSTPANATTPATPSADNTIPLEVPGAAMNDARPPSATRTTASAPANRSAMGAFSRPFQGNTISSPTSSQRPAVEAVPMIATSTFISARPLDRSVGAAVFAEPAPSLNEYLTANRMTRSESLGEVSSRKTSMPPIYGEDDPDVLPPKPLLPRLLAGLIPSSPRVRRDALTIAVIVNEDGTVDSVRWLVAPGNLSEAVLLTQALSMVKSWRFSPAMQDGEPVKYRQIVPIKDLMGSRF